MITRGKAHTLVIPVMCLVLAGMDAPASAVTRFTKWNDLAAPQRAQLGTAEQSIHKIESDSGQCSAAIISNRGHLLTARHCLQICLLRAKVFREVRSPNDVPYYDLDRPRLGQATCPVTIDGTPTEIVIEATSPGFIDRFDEPSLRLLDPDLYQRLTDQGDLARGDFVVARVNEPHPHWHCARLSATTASVGEPVFSLGYPSETSRADGQNSDGESLYYTDGQRVRTVAQSSCLQSPSAVAAHIDAVTDLIQRFAQVGEVDLDLDAIYGSSGAPVFNQVQEIVAMLSNVMRLAAITGDSQDEPEQRYCSDSAQGLSIEQVRSLVRGLGLNLDELSHCDEI